MKRKSIIILWLLCFSLLLTACSISVTGKWKDEATGMVTMEFLDDGTLKIYVQDKLQTTATYEADGDTITWTVDGSEKTAAYKIEGNKLSVTESGTTETMVYVRQ
jgi:predicted small secreted protein